MANGYLIDANGKVAAHVHGLVAGPPTGFTFVQADNPTLPVGSTAPAAFADAVAATDKLMSRTVEDLVTALITKGAIAWSDLPAQARTHINARRNLRGQAAL